jgi:hypothetical protein
MKLLSRAIKTVKTRRALIDYYKNMDENSVYKYKNEDPNYKFFGKINDDNL